MKILILLSLLFLVSCQTDAISFDGPGTDPVTNSPSPVPPESITSGSGPVSGG